MKPSGAQSPAFAPSVSAAICFLRVPAPRYVTSETWVGQVGELSSWRTRAPLAGANCPTGGNCSTFAAVSAGQTATYNLQLMPVSAFNGTVTLSCSGGAPSVNCTVSPALLTPNGTSASPFAVAVTTTAPSMVGGTELPINIHVPLIFALAAMLASVAAWGWRPKPGFRSSRRGCSFHDCVTWLRLRWPAESRHGVPGNVNADNHWLIRKRKPYSEFDSDGELARVGQRASRST